MTAPRLAWGLFGLWVVCGGVAIAATLGSDESFEAVFVVAMTVFAVVGALVASRQPRNAIGWLLLAIVLVAAAGSALTGYTSTADDPLLPLLWLDDWVSDVWIGLIALGISLLFPDGRPPSPRWRPWGWFAAGCFAFALAGRMFGDRILDTEFEPDPPNPHALPGAAGDVLAAVASASGALYAVAAITRLAGLVVRLRRSRGIERQQLKWFAFVGALMLVTLLLAALSLLDRRLLPLGAVAWGAFLAIVTVGLPVTIGTAILRHRLYDIDVVINRTLVYGALTASLGATYLGLVLLLGLTVGESNLAIAVSTLAVAALFRPLRARIQAAVDRRFYRRRYDAALTLEAFGAHLRHELDLDTLAADLRGVVQDTVQPAHVTLWLPPEGRST